MKKKPVIFLPTVQNTGTWFIIEMLLKHPSVTEFMEDRFLSDRVKKPSPYHGRPQSFSKTNKKGCGILQTHVHYMKNMDAAARTYFATLVCSLPTVVPMRDPLSSILTLRERRFRREGKIVFEQMANRVLIWKQFVRDLIHFQQFTNQISILPLDVLGKQSVKERACALVEMCNTVGLPLNTKYIREASHWPVVHSIGTYETKKFYKKGMRNEMKKALGPAWKSLCDIESATRPFFERLGYKNLMWWHDYQKGQQ